jgi:hypothetical protein
MKSFKKLALYSHILPALEKVAWPEEYVDVAHLAESDVKVFDCKSLPFDFVMDAGGAAFHEGEQTKKKIKLPFEGFCYFEFANFAVHAREFEIISHHDFENSDETTVAGSMVEVRGFTDWHGMSIDEYAEAQSACFAHFKNGIDLNEEGSFEPSPDVPFFGFANEPSDLELQGKVAGAVVGKGDYEMLRKAKRETPEKAARVLLGVLTLLNEKLVLSRTVPDPAPKLSEARQRRGLPPVSGPHHVLTVNVPAVRRLARATPLGTHESPALHWRRGHWRVLHRGSEFESTAWVRMCLVGDPSKGFVGKSYKLVHEQTMIVPVEPQLPELIGA